MSSTKLLFAAAALCTSLLQAQTGTAVPELAELDTVTTGLLAKYNIPGAAVAVSYRGRLVYARGFGVTDRGQTTPVNPDSLFRIASVSKPLTSLGILKLLDQGKLRLDDRAFSQILTDFTPPPGKTADSRYAQVTVRQLLQHTSGLAANLTGDPTTPPVSNQAAQAFNVPSPAPPEFLVRNALSIPATSTPGTDYSYSNVGFTALSRIIAKVSGKSYERFMQDEVFAPLGVTRMRIARTKLSERAPGEVRYHMFTGDALVNSVFPGEGTVERPYGSIYLEGLEGAGAWVASMPDLTRILSRIEQSQPDKVISSAAFTELIKRPDAPVSVGTNVFYGLGFNVRPVGNSATIFHTGSLPGHRSYIVRYSNDICLAYTFNMRVQNETDFGLEADNLYSAAMNRQRTWPQHDFFPIYFPAERARVADGGVVSAASFRPGAVSPGQIVTLFGTNLGPKQLSTARLDAQGRLANSLEGTRVLFDGTPAPLVYTFETQVSAIVPYNVGGKSKVRIEVERLGVVSSATEYNVVEAAPAFFTANSAGTGPAAATVFPSDRIAVLYATGEGLSNPLPVDGSLAVTQPLPSPRLPVKVLLGSGASQREAEILYAGAAPGLTAGLFQINIRYPEGTPSGTELTLQVGNARSPQGVTLTIP
jgi:N-acyl-D-amino-acid deacylase